MLDEPDDAYAGALARVVFRDGNERFRLCIADLVLADLARTLAVRRGAPGAGLLARVEIPRGANDVAVAFAIEAQLARLHDGIQRGVRSTAVRGSIIIVGTDTAVHTRLGEVSVEGIPLDLGLKVLRVRSDGRLVGPASAPMSFQPGRKELLYLNTRVGWPGLPRERDGLVIIDRTSFSSSELLDAALKWTHAHAARHVVFLHDHGDPEAKKQADIAWTFDTATLAALVPPLHQTGSMPKSGLTIAPLVSGRAPTLGLARVEAPSVETLLASISRHIAAARRVDSRLPYPLFAAARLLGAGNLLAGQVGTHDRAAAGYAQPLRDLLRAVVRGHSRLQGPWVAYRETRYAALRADVEGLISALEVANPKYEALVFLLDELRRRRPRPEVVVRAADAAAAFALEEDIFDVDPDLTENVRFLPFKQRLPWNSKGPVEVLAGLPAPWRREALWSGEAPEKIILAYGWEAAVLERLMEAEWTDTCAHVPPQFSFVEAVPKALETVFHHKQGTASPATSPHPFDIDLGVLVGEVEPDIDAFGNAQRQDLGGRSGRDAWPVLARAVTLDPDGALWFVPEGSEVDVLIGQMFRRLPVTSLAYGTEVIVPRGSGRETLFARALAVMEGQGKYVDVEFVLGRWRRACRSLLQKAGTSAQARRMLQDAGATTHTQLEAWAEGCTLAPNDYGDMLRVAHLAEDEWLERNWKRVAALVRQVRGSHISLGQTISGAMREAVAGQGPNLDRLADLLGLDPTSILDEFDIRVVRSVSAPITVPSSVAGSVVRPDGKVLPGQTARQKTT